MRQKIFECDVLRLSGGDPEAEYAYPVLENKRDRLVRIADMWRRWGGTAKLTVEKRWFYVHEEPEHKFDLLGRPLGFWQTTGSLFDPKGEET